MASSNPSSVVAPPLSKFEFQADDGAWYNVLLELNDDALTVNYCLLSSDDHEVFKPTHFTTLDDLESFARRFRPSSLQLQDDECQKVVPCMRVLAACRSGYDDVRFYEAIIEEVVSISRHCLAFWASSNSLFGCREITAIKERLLSISFRFLG